MNTSTKKQRAPRRKKDATKRKEPKNKRIYVTTRLYNKLTDIKKTLRSKSYEEVISFLVSKLEEGEVTLTDVESFESGQEYLIEELTSESELAEPMDLIEIERHGTHYERDDGLEQDLIFIPSPIKSSKITNNRNKILSTPQPEQFGAERNDDMEQELIYIPSPLKSSNVVSTPQSDQVNRQHMPFDDLNESTIVEFTEESSGDENIGNAGDFTYTPENLEADDEEESDNVLCGPQLDFSQFEEQFINDEITLNEEEVTATSYVKNQFYVVHEGCLKELFTHIKPKKCPVCHSKSIRMDVKVVGTSVILKWRCYLTHEIFSWSSQPKLRRGVNLGDLMLGAASLLFSGNNFAKLELFSRFMNMPFINKSTYYRYQANYFVPVVEKVWEDVRATNIAKSKNEPVVVLADGRMDSPGFNTNFCTYVLMNNAGLGILDVVVIDKREVGLKSTNMEKEGLVRGLKSLQKDGINVVEIATDAHSQITKLARQEYQHIKHSYDIWHGAKNLAKKISKIAKKKNCSVLKQWLRSIVNHFWYCIKKSETYADFTSKWKSLLHHVTGTHTWAVGDGGTGQCDHGTDHEDLGKELIAVGSVALKELRKVVWDARFLKKIRYFLNFRSTAVIENFNDCLLMYCSKRFGYQYPGYKARCLLAAIDYSYHKDRPLLFSKDGRPRMKRKFNKNSDRWTVFQEKVRKSYGYIAEMQNEVIRKYNETKTTRCRIVLQPGDPRLIAPTIAPFQSPPTALLVEEMKSRFS